LFPQLFNKYWQIAGLWVRPHHQCTAQACRRIHIFITQPDTVSRSIRTLVLCHLRSHTGEHLMGLTLESISGDLQGGCQSLCCDVVSVTDCPLLLRVWDRKDHADAAGDLKARCLTGIPQATDTVRCRAFSLKFFGDRGV